MFDKHDKHDKEDIQHRSEIPIADALMIAKKIKSVNFKDIKPPTITKSMQRLKQVYTMN